MDQSVACETGADAATMTRVWDGFRRHMRRARKTGRVWLRDIWQDDWDAHRRSLLLRHYWGYLRRPPLATRHLPESLVPTSAGEQRAFSMAFRSAIDRVQTLAPRCSSVYLTYRPIGKNLRLLGTAVCANTRRGRATAIAPGGPPTEEAQLASQGHAWNPWIWSRTDRHADLLHDHARDTGTHWARCFEPLTGATPGEGQHAGATRLAAGDGAFGRPHLEDVLRLAAATSYVFRPVKCLEARASALKQSLAWPVRAPVLGMHIRRGDAAASDGGSGLVRRSTRTSFALNAYLAAADSICSAYGIRHVYVATESDEDLAQAQRLRPQYEFLAAPHDRSIFPDIRVSSQFVEDVALEDPARGRALAESAILDLCLFRDCDAVIGTFNSEFSVLAWLLVAGNRGHMIPYISLSQPRTGWTANPFEALLNPANNCPLELYHW